MNLCCLSISSVVCFDCLLFYAINLRKKKYTTQSKQFQTIVEKHAKSKPYGIN